MDWLLPVIRAILPGIFLGLFLGYLLDRKPRYIKYFKTKFLKREFENAGWKKWGKVIVGAFAGVAMIYLVHFTQSLVVSNVGSTLSEDNIFSSMMNLYYPLYFVIITVFPIFEEWIFRGIILEEIRIRFSSNWIALALSTVIFAAFHLTNPGMLLPSLIVYTVGGFILGLGYIWGGLSTSITIHVLYNSGPVFYFVLRSLILG